MYYILALIRESGAFRIQNSRENLQDNIYVSVSSKVAKLLQDRNFGKIS